MLHNVLLLFFLPTPHLSLQQLTECTLRRVVADDPLAVADLRPEDIVG